MAETRTVLIGMGILFLIAGFFLTNLLCGVGVIFLIIGLVMWQKDSGGT